MSRSSEPQVRVVAAANFRLNADTSCKGRAACAVQALEGADVFEVCDLWQLARLLLFSGRIRK
jgi:hypothetical protein